MADKVYQPSSSDSDSGPLESTRILRGDIVGATSQSSDIAELSPSPCLTPSCQTSLESFHLSKPSAKRKWKYGLRKKTFVGSRRHEKLPETSTPVRKADTYAQTTSHVFSLASKKLCFETTTKKQKQDLSSFTEESEMLHKTSKQVIGNCIINFNVLQSILDCMLCGQCSTAGMRILDPGLVAGCAQYILLVCPNCNWIKYSWTVPGKFRQKISVGDQEIVKRNEMVYSSVLAGRLMGVGLQKSRFITVS